jgi:hypothetical protein
VINTLKLIQEERDRQLAERRAQEAGVQEQGDVEMSSAVAAVAPQSAADPADMFTPFCSTGKALVLTIAKRTDALPVRLAHPMGQAAPSEHLRHSFFGCTEDRWSDPHWLATPAQKLQITVDVPVDGEVYRCEEISDKAIRNGAFLYIVPFSRADLWATAEVNWRDYDLRQKCVNDMSFRIVTYLRHLAPLRRNRARHCSAMDRGGWIAIRDLAIAVGLEMDGLLSVLYAMSKDPKDRIQIAMLYRKENTPNGLVWKNFGVAQVRACQGHSIPWVMPERLGVSISAEHVDKLQCLCHGTTHEALPKILRGSLKPASHIPPDFLERPGNRATLMMSPYPYTDKENYIGGARKNSELYVFLDRDRVAALMKTSDRQLYLTHRAAVITQDGWPWHCIQCVVAPGFKHGGPADALIYHEFAVDWPNPECVTEESLAKWQKYQLDPTFDFESEDVSAWEDARPNTFFYCPCCHAPCRRGLLLCLRC